MASLKGLLQPALTGLLTSDALLQTRRQGLETWRRLARYPHRIGVWLRADDPYSFLLSQALLQFRQDFPDVVWELHILRGVDEQTTSEPERLARYAFLDSQRLASWLDLKAPSVEQLDATQLKLTEAALVATSNQSDHDALKLAHKLLKALWQGDTSKTQELIHLIELPAPQILSKQLTNNREQQRRQGHYASAMLHYAGEWYWGVDRLGHLAERLSDLELGTPTQRWHPDLDSHFLNNEPTQLASIRASEGRLDFYFSFRSPYSYLALQGARDLAEHYGLRLVMRPVLPMVMRGLPVPDSKKRYILEDASREARRQRIPFGRICDPLGAGVERCLAVWLKAESSHQRGFDFINAAARRIWSEGADMSQNAPLLAAAKEAGLKAIDVKIALADNSWRERVERHRKALYEMQLWGVPSFVLRVNEQRCATWGQDRLWVIEDALHQLVTK
ncbi:MAG: DsbA family protein [Moraxellaceae bacterium]|nr:DsbA family protein [Moraxellaceae bacterium]MDP1775043.1 DsbA family protein [Moraxellaceae bacterium]